MTCAAATLIRDAQRTERTQKKNSAVSVTIEGIKRISRLSFIPHQTHQPTSLTPLTHPTKQQQQQPFLFLNQSTAMAPNAKQITNTRILISKIPEGVAPNKSHFRSITYTEDAPVLKQDEILVKNLIFSLDPCKPSTAFILPSVCFLVARLGPSSHTTSLCNLR